MSTYMIHALHSTGNKAPTGCKKREVDHLAQEALVEDDQLETLTWFEEHVIFAPLKLLAVKFDAIVHSTTSITKKTHTRRHWLY